MRDTAVTRKQFSAAIFTALLSPLLRVLPRQSVSLAGKAAWLGVVPAFCALLILAALMNALRRRLRPGEGMANLIMRALGPVLGRLLLLLYAAWFLFYAGFILRSGAERLGATVYQQSNPYPFIFVMLALCLLAALGTLRASTRTAVILRAILILSLALVFLFALSNISLENLFPLGWMDAPRVVLSAWPIITVGGVAALFSFLNAYVEPVEKPMKWILPPLLVFCAAAGLLCFETVGSFGQKLTVRLRYPFFTMTRDVSIFNLSQRIEAVVIALWAFADFIICILLLRCANEALRTIFGFPKAEDLPHFSLRRGRWLFLPEAVAVYLCSQSFASSSFIFSVWSEKIVPLLSNCFAFGGFSLVWLVGTLRRQSAQQKPPGG